MTTLLIVDDESPQRLAVRMILERQPGLTVVGETGNGSEAVRMASALQPDIVLMDVHMPGMDGTEATGRIVDSGSRSRVLVLTTFDLEERVYKALRAGASGFLLKDARPEELIAAVHAVARGDAVIAPSLTRKLLDTFAQRLHSPVPDQDHDDSGRLHHLTGREREVSPASHRVGATERSPRTCIWPKPRSSHTSAASSPRSVPGPASRRWLSPTTQGSSDRTCACDNLRASAELSKVLLEQRTGPGRRERGHGLAGAALCLGQLLDDNPERDDAEAADQVTEDLLPVFGLPSDEAHEN